MVTMEDNGKPLLAHVTKKPWSHVATSRQNTDHQGCIKLDISIKQSILYILYSYSECGLYGINCFTALKYKKDSATLYDITYHGNS